MSLGHENSDEQKQEISAEEVLASRKSSIRNTSWWAVGIGGFLVFVHLMWLIIFNLIGLEKDFSILFRSIFFILGLVALIGGIWGFYYAKSLNLSEIVPTEAAIRYLSEVRNITPYYTYILVLSVVLVFVVQVIVDDQAPNESGLPHSINVAGLIKPLVSQGEIWRLLTAGTLHGGFLHIYFNGQALYGLGTTIEYLSNRAHLAIVFVLAIVVGSLFSWYFMPEVPSVGASGGIMGIIGYAAMLGYRRKHQMPPDFLKNMLINIGFIAAFGLVAYNFIDNFAHFGGLLVGIVYGFLQIPKNLEKDPRKTGFMADFWGMIAMGIFVFTSILSILLILGEVKF